MARVEVTPVELEINSYKSPDLEDMTTEGASIEIDDFANLLICVENEDTEVAKITIKSGNYSDHALGDLVVPVDASSSIVIGPLESARFKTNDGSVLIDTESTGSTLDGKIGAYLAPE